MCEFLLNVYFAGTAGDSLGLNNGMKFTTQDVDNDLSSWANCAQRWHGAWWFPACGYAHLNGEYRRGRHDLYAKGIYWYHFKENYNSYKVAEMKVAPHKN